MRFLTLIFIASFLFSCEKESKIPDFLIGTWERINDESNKKTYEIWKKDFSGLGFTLRDKDTVFKEKLNIVTKKNNQYLKVTGVNQQPTFFVITTLTENSFTCENSQNEFPKKISYWLENETLNAKVANDDFAIDFVFKKIE